VKRTDQGEQRGSPARSEEKQLMDSKSRSTLEVSTTPLIRESASPSGDVRTKSEWQSRRQEALEVLTRTCKEMRPPSPRRRAR
jgi:hypothetical protein